MGHQLLLKLVLQENKKMPLTLRETKLPQELPRGVMQANVFRKLGSLAWKGKPIPTAGPGQTVIQVRLTTIC